MTEKLLSMMGEIGAREMSWIQSKHVGGNGAGGPGAQRAVGERSAGAAGAAASAPPDPELAERPQRRRFSAAYKIAVLREADGLTAPGAVGALLRREGLYSSHLSTWRRQREAGALEAFSRPRGRRPADPLERENAELRRDLTRAESELAKARRVIEVQGEVCALLGELVEPGSAIESESSAS
jgi:transposase-like protein